MAVEVERELLRKCRAGDWEAYEPIVRAYEGRLFGLAIGIVHNADDARDLVQDSFVRAFKSMDLYDPERPFLAWILSDRWAAVWQEGLRVIDVSDITNPQTIGAYNYHPPIPEPTHTVMPFEQTIGGRRYALAIDEEHEHIKGRLHGFMTVIDVTDLSDIRPVSVFNLSELDSPFSRVPKARFGAHQFREKLDSTLVYSTWFSGGLRIIDFANPELPVEVGHYIPTPVGDAPAPASNDVDLDRRGLIYVIDRVRGLDIIEYSGSR